MTNRRDEHGRFDHRVALRLRVNVILHTLPINVKYAEPLTVREVSHVGAHFSLPPSGT